MPLYDYVDTNTKKRVAILRPFDQYEDLPARDECTNLTDEEYTQAKWERQIAAPKMVKGRSWGPGKGYW